MEFSTDFAVLSAVESAMKEDTQSNMMLGSLIDHVLTTRKAQKDCEEEVDRLNKLILDILLDKDSKKQGMFHCGKLLYEGKYIEKDEVRGMKLIEKSASSYNKSALLFLIEHYSSLEEWKRVLGLRRSLYEAGDKFQFVDFICEHPDLYSTWCRKIIESIIREGYFLSDSVSMESKVLLTSFYIRFVTDDVTVIAENLPDDSDFMQYISIFFDKLPSSSTNPDVQYFIGYNYINGISCDRDIDKGRSIMQSLKHTKRNLYKYRNDMTYLASLLPDECLMKILFLGESLTGKTTVFSQQFKGEPFEKASSYMVTIGVDFANFYLTRFNKTLKFQIWDTSGPEKFRNIILPYLEKLGHGTAVIFHGANCAETYNCEYWYNLIREIAPQASIVALIAQCDLSISNPEKLNSLEQYYYDRNVKCIRISAKTGLGLDEFLDTLFEVSVRAFLKASMS